MDKTLRYLAILLLLCGSGFAQILAPIVGGHTVTWTFKQVACSTQTGCTSAAIASTGTTATATFSSALTAGDTVAFFTKAVGSTAPSSVSLTGGGSLTHDATCSQTSAGNGLQLDCYYIASVSGGQTAVVVNFASSTTFFFVVVVAHKTGGTPVFDTSSKVNDQSCSASCTGANLTLTGTNDFIARGIIQGGANASAVTGSYTFINPNSSDFPNNGVYLAGTSSGTGPTYTYSVTDLFDEGDLAFK